MVRNRTFIVSSVIAALASAAVAQDVSSAKQAQRADRINELERLRLDTRQRVNQDIPAGERVFFDYGAYVTASYLTVDDALGDGHVLRQYELLPYARLNVDGVHEFFVRGIIGYQDFNDGDSFTGRGDEPIDGDLDRAYYRFDLARAMAAYNGQTPSFKFTVQGGRDFVYWGNGLVLARALDGGLLTVGTDKLDLTLLAGITPVRTVDFDTSRPGFDYNTRRGFYGALLTADLGDHRPYAYLLHQQDYNGDNFRRVSLIDTRYDYESSYAGVGSTGSLFGHLQYAVEGVYEFGHSKSNSFTIDGFGLFPTDQTSDPIEAYAFDGRLDYLLDDRRQTRLSAELTLASGDTNRGNATNTFNGNRPNTADHGFNAFGLINTGLAFGPQVTNLAVVRVGAATFPLPDVALTRRLQVGTDLFFLTKFQDDAPIDEATGDHRFLGLEPDFYVNWQATSDVTLAFRYGIFFPNGDNFGSDDPRQLFYAGITLAL